MDGDGSYIDDPDLIGGTDPWNPPDWVPPHDPVGWWEFINGAWRWITQPAPDTVAN